jgi:hypothetical protein
MARSRITARARTEQINKGIIIGPPPANHSNILTLHTKRNRN